MAKKTKTAGTKAEETKTMTTFYPLTDKELQAAACREVNSEEESNHENEKHRAVEFPQHVKHHQKYEEILTKIKDLSDKMITTQDPDIIRACVKEMQMSAPNGDFKELCESFFTGDSTRVDIRREIYELVDAYKRQQIMADLEPIAKKYDMNVKALLEFMTSDGE